MDGSKQPDVELTIEIVQRILDGDIQAWTSIHERHRDALVALAHGRLRGDMRRRVDTEDVVQSTFVAAVEKLERFEYRGRGSLDAWLKQILVHRITQKIRHHLADKRDVRRHATASAIESRIDFTAMSPGDALVAAEEHLRTINAIEELPEVERRLVVATHIDGLSTADLASELGMDPSTVWRRRAAALEMLGKKLS